MTLHAWSVAAGAPSRASVAAIAATSRTAATDHGRTIISTVALVLLGGAAIAEQGGAGGGKGRDARLKEREPELFKQADANGDGVLNEQERATLGKLMAEKQFAHFDTDKGGFISKTEFEAAAEARVRRRPLRLGRRCFQDRVRYFVAAKRSARNASIAAIARCSASAS